jgi:hypothetical protein
VGLRGKKTALSFCFSPSLSYSATTTTTTTTETHAFYGDHSGNERVAPPFGVLQEDRRDGQDGEGGGDAEGEDERRGERRSSLSRRSMMLDFDLPAGVVFGLLKAGSTLLQPITAAAALITSPPPLGGRERRRSLGLAHEEKIKVKKLA